MLTAFRRELLTAQFSASPQVTPTLEQLLGLQAARVPQPREVRKPSYHGTTGNRCAERPFSQVAPDRRYQSKCSISVQLCVLPMRLETVDAVLTIASDSNHACSARVAQLHVCRQTMLPRHPSIPHNRPWNALATLAAKRHVDCGAIHLPGRLPAIATPRVSYRTPIASRSTGRHPGRPRVASSPPCSIRSATGSGGPCMAAT